MPELKVRALFGIRGLLNNLLISAECFKYLSIEEASTQQLIPS